MKPMLAHSMELASINSYLVDDGWAAQQKLDGDRILMVVQDGKVTALNRNGEPRRNAVPRTVLAPFERFSAGNWCFDGELLGDELWLFDLPEAMDKVSCSDPFEFRFQVLAGLVPNLSARSIRLVPTAWTTAEKEKLLDGVHSAGAEGLMFKDRTGVYRPGRRSQRMLKAKFTQTADAVVSKVGVEGRENCELVMFREGAPVSVGSCSLLGKPPVLPGDVIEVRYLYASDDSKLYQPRVLRVRTDKPSRECTTDQLHFTNRDVVTFTEELT